MSGQTPTRHRGPRFVGAGLAALLLAAGGAALGQAKPAPKTPAPAAAAAIGAVDGAFFSQAVQPLLEKRCLGCHGVGARLSGLDLRSRASALRGGTRGPALVPGSAAKSVLFGMVSGARSPQMPPTGKLPASEVGILERWLDGGAPWPDGSVETARKQVWWSFKTPVRPKVPALQSAWIRNPIDAFILQRLREQGLSPSPPAPRRVLIRRAYLDLIGLPPSPEEVRAFEADRSPAAWEKVVDRLLASPHYGERWGRHWLDLVRYADSSGFEGDKDRPLAWRYRDYVIDAFNSDKPYPEFIREQLAGDELAGPQANAAAPAVSPREAIVATGYLGCGQEDFAMAKLPPTRADELDDLVSTTGSVFLGLTVGCARCHDHKYDPIKQTDYYRLQAIFAPTERREIEIPTPEERREADAANAALEKEAAPLRQRLEALRQKGTGAAAAGQAKPNDDQVAAALAEADRKEWTDLQARIKGIEAKRVALPKAMAVTDKARQYEPVHLLIRGDAYHPGPVVQPGFIAALPGGSTDIGPDAATAAATTGRRRALAEWLAGPQNPLTARVWINRVWRQHFGRGIVATPSNFGVSGELPTHPELLDYLASVFVSPSSSNSTSTLLVGPQPRLSAQKTTVPRPKRSRGASGEGQGRRGELAALPPANRAPGPLLSWNSILAVGPQPRRSAQKTAVPRPKRSRGASGDGQGRRDKLAALPPSTSVPGPLSNSNSILPVAPSPHLPVSPSPTHPHTHTPTQATAGFAWHLKPLHRLILLSSTYQQSSAVRPEGMRRDPLNRLLWRVPVRRLEAEVIRDCILSAAGSLNPAMGGPPVYPPVDPSLRADTFQGFNWPEGEDSPKTWRRSVYVKVKRSLLLPELEVFDCPEITASVAQRNVTTTPTQALTLLNDPLVLRQAGLFAQRVAREAGPDPGRQVERAYLLAFGRAPTAREAALALAFLKKPAVSPGMPRLAELCHAVFNLNEFVYVP